jgi:hypothetical protein
LPLRHVFKPAIDGVAILDFDLIVAEVSGLPSHVYLDLESFERDICGSIEAQVIMRPYRIRAFKDGETGHALTYSFGSSTEKRSI